MNATQSSENISYEGDSSTYKTILVKIYLKRRTLFFILNYVLPCFAVSVLCLLGYLLPVESGQKLPIG